MTLGATSSVSKSEQFAGFLLIGCTAPSLVLANSPLSSHYFALWHAPGGALTIEHWINDGLMAVASNSSASCTLELSRPCHALLPAFASPGGMAAPAAIHSALDAGTPTQPGFGIPMATDIAFVPGVLALPGAGSRRRSKYSSWDSRSSMP